MAIAIKKNYNIDMGKKSNVLSEEEECRRVERQYFYYLYILRINKSRLYIGITDNIKRRFLEHKRSKGAKFTKYSDSIELVHTEEFNSLQDAMKREKQLKGWTRAKKEALIAKDCELLKKL